MADKTPGASAQSFAGVSIVAGLNVASVGYPKIAKTSIEAMVQSIGQNNPVDLLNGTAAPKRQTVTLEVLVRADDSITDPVAAKAAIMNGYHALEGMAEVGTLIIDIGGGLGNASCTARRKPIDLLTTPSNARFHICTLVFTPLSDWV